jgi:hypothetical protein
VGNHSNDNHKNLRKSQNLKLSLDPRVFLAIALKDDSFRFSRLQKDLSSAFFKGRSSR